MVGREEEGEVDEFAAEVEGDAKGEGGEGLADAEIGLEEDGLAVAVDFLEGVVFV